MQTLTAQYSYGLVAVSVVISMIAATASFSLVERMRSAARGRARLGWLLGGSCAMGVGIWTMHYLGMLALRLPVEVAYDLPMVALSVLPAVIAAAVTLSVISVDKLTWQRLAAGGILMGAGIGSMHYLGMEAMRMQAMHHYNPRLVVLSLVAAVVLATVALWVAVALRSEEHYGRRARVLGGAFMGCAIAGMHYIAMYGVTYMADSMPMRSSRWVLRVNVVGQVAIAVFTLLVLVFAIGSATLDRKQYRALQELQKGLVAAQDELLRQQQELIESQQRLMEANAMLSELSVRDGLTGLYNRRRFDQVLETEWRRASRDSKPLALIVLDIDHFKALNDVNGHQYGDECLRQVADVLNSSGRRPYDVVARYGGEEFAVLLPGASGPDSLRIAEQLCAAVEGLGLKHPSSSTGSVVTISAGVCSREPTKGEPQVALLRDADAALYTAKRSGRNRAMSLHAMADIGELSA